MCIFLFLIMSTSVIVTTRYDNWISEKIIIIYSSISK
jgi:hypothetical protein